MDRVNISFAALQMNVDLGFSATVYGLGGGLFFLSYALFEVPSNVFLARFGARRWLARIMISWGLLAAGMMFVRSPLHFYVLRFLLGMAEAGFFPGAIYYLAHWFPRSHRGRAIGPLLHHRVARAGRHGRGFGLAAGARRPLRPSGVAVAVRRPGFRPCWSVWPFFDSCRMDPTACAG